MHRTDFAIAAETKLPILMSWRQFARKTIAAQLHLLGAIAMFCGGIPLAELAAQQGEPHFWVTLIFSASGVLLFSVSATYHFLHDGFGLHPRHEHLFEILDQFSIYTLIAGTYTPVVFMALSAPWDQRMLIMIWSLAAFGIVYTAVRTWLPKWAQSRLVYTGFFVLMGWSFFVCARELFSFLSAYQLALVLSGGATYSIGALCYALRKPSLFPGWFGFHELWHLLVLLGCAHFYALIFDLYS